MGSWTIEGTTIETNPPESETVSPLSPDGVPVCVNTTDASDATANCISYCNAIDPWYADQAMNSEYQVTPLALRADGTERRAHRRLSTRQRCRPRTRR